jgi:hypothetical protein
LLAESHPARQAQVLHIIRTNLKKKLFSWAAENNLGELLSTGPKPPPPSDWSITEDAFRQSKSCSLLLHVQERLEELGIMPQHMACVTF